MSFSFKKIFRFPVVFIFVIAIFILSLAITISYRGGRDLKPGLFGVEMVLQKKSPYANPTDPNRTIFRYAPGITLLQYPYLMKAEMVAPFTFKHIMPSVFAWYFTEVVCLILSGFALFKLIPGASPHVSARNLKIAFLLSLPFIGYELSNSQNKLVALSFLLLALLLFERKQMFFCAVSLCLALTIYIPLFAFAFYFFIKSKGRFLFSFILGALCVFFIIPSLFFGVRFNLYLLKEWFDLSLKPFFLTNSFSTYIDLRESSQSLPSVIGRVFVSGNTENFRYLIPSTYINAIIRFFSAGLILFSCFAAWKGSSARARGLECSMFLILALVLPQYCIYYTWAYSFVFFFAVFNYVSFPDVPLIQKRILLGLALILFISIFSALTPALKIYSILFWGTFAFWLGIGAVAVKNAKNI